MTQYKDNAINLCLSSSSGSHLNHNHAYVSGIIIGESKPAYKDEIKGKESLIA